MKNLRLRFERFCFKNRDKGIKNLMLYISLGAALVYLMSVFAGSRMLYDLLAFDRILILQGQIWRLFTYPLAFNSSNILLTAVMLFCYYSLGRAMENVWGTLRFNLFYLSGILLMDIYCMIFDGYADAGFLNLSLFLSYATMFPDSQFLIFFIIPVKARFFALFDLILVLIGFFSNPFPYNFFSVISIANYLLFFGKDVLNVIPLSWRMNARRLFRRAGTKKKAKTIPFPNAGSYEASVARPREDYTHRCTVCGRTDVTNPELEFRYCSLCKGYHCYCIEHIDNHSHVE